MNQHARSPFSLRGANSKAFISKLSSKMTLGQKVFWFASLCIFGALLLVGVIGYGIAKSNLKEQIGKSTHQSVIQATEK